MYPINLKDCLQTSNTLYRKAHFELFYEQLDLNIRTAWTMLDKFAKRKSVLIAISFVDAHISEHPCCKTSNFGPTNLNVLVNY